MWRDINDSLLNNDPNISNYNIGANIKKNKFDELKNAYILNKTDLLVIDSSSIYNIPNFRPDLILLRQSPKINLDRVIDSLKPKQIICDGSNYKSYIERWERTCRIKKLPFHRTDKKGAFIYNY